MGEPKKTKNQKPNKQKKNRLFEVVQKPISQIRHLASAPLSVVCGWVHFCKLLLAPPLYWYKYWNRE